MNDKLNQFIADAEAAVKALAECNQRMSPTRDWHNEYEQRRGWALGHLPTALSLLRAFAAVVEEARGYAHTYPTANDCVCSNCNQARRLHAALAAADAAVAALEEGKA